MKKTPEKKPAGSMLAASLAAPTHNLAPRAVPEDTVQRVLQVEKILPRVLPPARVIQPDHVVALADTIAALSLLQGPVVDRNYRLMAGEHRRCAVMLLLLLHKMVVGNRDTPSARLGLLLDLVHKADTRLPVDYKPNPGSLATLQRLDTTLFAQKFHPDGRIPVRIIPVDTQSDPLALKMAEVAENDIRENFNKQEVINVAEDLKRLGYKATAGRPKAGEKALVPALSVMFKRSLRQISRLLNEKPAETEAKPKPKPSVIPATLRDLELLRQELEGGDAAASAQTKAILTLSSDLSEALQKFVETSRGPKKAKKK